MRLSIFIPKELEALAPDLQRFWDAQVFKLRKNAHKGKWESLNVAKAMALLDGEVSELNAAIAEGSSIEILMEAADVANFAAILANIALLQEQEPGQKGPLADVRVP
jgi:hypothetical protein